MNPKPELAYFAIADISGCARASSPGSRLRPCAGHPRRSWTVVKGLRPPFRLAKFEGDAAFVYTVAENATRLAPTGFR